MKLAHFGDAPLGGSGQRSPATDADARDFAAPVALDVDARRSPARSVNCPYFSAFFEFAAFNQR